MRAIFHFILGKKERETDEKRRASGRVELKRKNRACYNIKMDKYAVLADIYDKVMGNNFFQRWRPVVDKLLHICNVRYRSVADVACGTGGVLLYFYNKKKTVFGVDNSLKMIKLAKRKIGKRRIKIIKMDMRNFVLKEKMDLITCNFNTLNETQSIGDFKRAVSSIYDNLKPGGRAIFDVISVSNGRTAAGTKIYKIGNSMVIIKNAWDEEKKRIVLSLLLIKRNKVEKALTEEHVLLLHHLKDLRKYLKEIGFREVKAFSFPELKVARENCPRYIFVVRK